MGYTATFYDALKTRIAAVVDGAAAKVFNQVWLTAFLDVDRLLDATRLPAAIITDNGGETDPHNGVVVTRRFSVTIVHAVLRDHVGEASIKAIFDAGERLTTELLYNSANSVFNAGPDEDVEAIGTDTENLLLIVKTYRFVAQFQRSDS